MDAVAIIETNGAGGGGATGAPPSPPVAGSRARAGPITNPIIAEMICEALQDPDRGHRRSLRSICDDYGFDRREVNTWLLADADFAAAYERARGHRFDDMAEECLEIADNTGNDDIIDQHGFRRPNKEWIARSRVRIQTRLDLLARWDPRRYGAKLELNSTNRNLNINVDLSADPNEAARQYQDIMRD